MSPLSAERDIPPMVASSMHLNLAMDFCLVFSLGREVSPVKSNMGLKMYGMIGNVDARRAIDFCWSTDIFFM